jgi:hypothetical protein
MDNITKDVSQTLDDVIDHEATRLQYISDYKRSVKDCV